MLCKSPRLAMQLFWFREEWESLSGVIKLKKCRAERGSWPNGAIKLEDFFCVGPIVHLSGHTDITSRTGTATAHTVAKTSCARAATSRVCPFKHVAIANEKWRSLFFERTQILEPVQIFKNFLVGPETLRSGHGCSRIPCFFLRTSLRWNLCC